jgi:hypothetical protein
MGIDVIKLVGDSFNTLLKNRTVMIFALISALLGSAFSLATMSQVQSLKNLGTGSALSSVLPIIFSVLGTFLIGIIILYLISVFLLGSMMVAASDSKKSIGDAASQSISRYLVFLVTSVVTSIITVIGLILFVIPGIFLGVKLSLASAEAMVGKKGVVDSLKASWSATTGNFWGIFFAFLVTIIAIYIISIIAVLVFTIVGLTPVGTFIGTFFGYAITVLIVLIYLSVSPKPAMRAAKKGKKQAVN